MQRIYRNDQVQPRKVSKSMKEASFRPGTALKIMGIIERILSKRVNFQVEYDLFDTFQTSKGKFFGYWAFGGDEQVYRFNFLLNDHDTLHSLDFFDDAMLVKERTFEFDESLNAVQLANEIVYLITGERLTQQEESRVDRRFKTSLQERKNLKPYIEDWLDQSEDRFDLLRSGSWDEIRSAIYQNWPYEGVKLPGDQTLKNHIRAIASDSGIENSSLRKRKYTKRQATLQAIDNSGENIADDEEEQEVELDTEYSQEVETEDDRSLLGNENIEDIEGYGEAFFQLDHWSERWNDYLDFWEFFLDGKWDWYKDSARGMIAHGKGGSGKSYYAKKMWKENPQKIAYVKGKDMKASAASVYEKVFENRDKDIIIFDDAGTIVSETAVDKYKTLFEPPAEGGAYVTPVTRDLKNKFKAAGVEEGFQFKGAVVIITNKTRRTIGDQAFRDRFFIVTLNFSPEETIDKIATEFDEENVTEDEKKAAARHLIRILHGHGIKPKNMSTSFRIFKKVITMHRYYPTKWKDKSKRQILGELRK